MVNNIGSTTVTLSTTIGNTTVVTDPVANSTIAMIAGELTVGAIISDAAGTISVVVSFDENAQQQYICILKTISTYTEMDVSVVLNDSY